MPRMPHGASHFYARRWSTWLDAVCTTLDLSSSQLAKQLDLQVSRVSAWRRGQQGVTPGTAFAVGQRISRKTQILEVSGPFAVFAAGHIVEIFDFFRRIGAGGAASFYKDMASQDSALAASRQTGINSSTHLSFPSPYPVEKMLALFDLTWNRVMSAAPSGFKAGSNSDIRFKAAEQSMETTRFMQQLLGSQDGFREACLMLDHWMQRFDRCRVDRDELADLQGILARYADMIERFARVELGLPATRSMEPPDPPECWTGDEVEFDDTEERFRSRLLVYGFLQALKQEATDISIAMLLSEPGTSPVFLPNMRDNWNRALPRISDLAWDIFNQANANK